MSDEKIEPEFYELYDEYCHSGMSRREFFERATALGVALGVAGCSRGEALVPNYADSQAVSFTDERINANYVIFDSPGGNAASMRGYLVAPTGAGPFPSVLVVHENRGLNPYIEDVARRVAVAGFVALAPDALYPVGGYPGNDDDGKQMQRDLDLGKILVDMQNSARHLRGHSLSNGKLGVVGFCFGGAVSNHLAATLGDEVSAASSFYPAPFYGEPSALEAAANVRGSLLLHFAEDDPPVNDCEPPTKPRSRKTTSASNRSPTMAPSTASTTTRHLGTTPAPPSSRGTGRCRFLAARSRSVEAERHTTVAGFRMTARELDDSASSRRPASSLAKTDRARVARIG